MGLTITEILRILADHVHVNEEIRQKIHDALTALERAEAKPADKPIAEGA